MEANQGKVTQVIGSTLDAQFAEDKLPAIYNALKTEIERTVLGDTVRETLWCEVAQHLGGGRQGRGRPVRDDGADGSVLGHAGNLSPAWRGVKR